MKIPKSRLGDQLPHHEADTGLPSDLIEQEYGDIGLGLLCRWEVYQYAADGRDLHSEIIDSLELTGAETVLDVGCAHGKVLDTIAPKHAGRLIGVDVVGDTFDFYHRVVGDNRYGIEFYQAGLPNLDIIEDHSVDCVLALFMLYHVEDVGESLAEIARILAPGGMVVVATSGEGNKLLHRKLESIIAKELGVEPPPIYSSKFNEETADILLSQYFSDITKTSQRTEMVIDSARAAEDYELSLGSMWASYDSADVAAWGRTVKNIMYPVLEPIKQGDSDAVPVFDTIDRHFYVCRTPL